MTDLIQVEPGAAQRGLFAQWCLKQSPPIQTSGHATFDVPLDLYPVIPSELLEGAVVDGFRLDVQMPQPVLPKAPAAPSEPVTPEVPVPESVPMLTAEKPGPARKRATRKRAATKPAADA